jgi:Peptidase family M28
MTEHPWAKDVRLTLNFEGRGNAGISQMFETSAENGRLIQEFALAAPHSFGSSLTYEIYKHLPNDTDMTVFKQHSSSGLNFAFLGHWEAYHAPIDTPENLSLSSLQHHGENALSLARHFGNGDLNSLRQRDSVYFSVPGTFLARYSTFWIWPLALLALALFLLSFLRLLRARQIRWKMALLAILALSILTALLPIGGFALSTFFHWLHNHVLPDGPVFQSTPYWLSAIALLAAVWAAIYLWLRKRLAAPNLAQAAAFILLILILVTSKLLSGGSYLVLWPLLSLLAAMWVGSRSETHRPSFVPTALLCLLTLPALAILTPALRSFFEGLGLTSAGGPAIALPLVLLLIALMPQIEIVSDALGPKLPFAALTIGLVCFGWGALTTRYSAARPKATMLYYALDADSSRVLWASTASRNDSWTAQFVGPSPTRGNLPDFMPGWYPFEFLRAEAPAVPLAPPEATLVDQSKESDARLLALRIRSQRAARSLSVRIPDNTVLESSVNGRPLPKPAPTRWNPGGKWNLSFVNLPPDGIELKLRVQGAGPVKLSVVDWSLGLPEIPGRRFDPRPPDTMTVHTGDQTLVRRTFVF